MILLFLSIFLLYPFLFITISASKNLIIKENGTHITTALLLFFYAYFYILLPTPHRRIKLQKMDTSGNIVATAPAELEIEQSTSEQSSRRFKFKRSQKKVSDGLSSDLVIIFSTYSAVCNIMTVFAVTCSSVFAGTIPAFFSMLVITCLFVYNLCLVVAGLRPNDSTMLDTIIGEIFPKYGLVFKIIGQFTSGWLVFVFQILCFEANSQIMFEAFSTSKNRFTQKTSNIIYIFILFAVSSITNPKIFVPLLALPTLGTVFGFIVVIVWVCRNTSPADLRGFKNSWSQRSGNWVLSTGDGLGAMFSLIGVITGNLYLQSMIQKILFQARNPRNNIRNTCIAYGLVLLTMWFIPLVSALPYGSYPAGRTVATNLVLDMGSSGLVRANNIIQFFFALPVIPFQWAIVRQNSIDLIPYERWNIVKWKYPIYFILQWVIILISFGVVCSGSSLQILIEVATFPAALYWICFLPTFHHIVSLYRDPKHRGRWTFWTFTIIDISVAVILFFCEIVQFITKW